MLCRTASACSIIKSKFEMRRHLRVGSHVSVMDKDIDRFGDFIIRAAESCLLHFNDL